MDWMTQIAVIIGHKIGDAFKSNDPPRPKKPYVPKEPVDLVKVIGDEMRRRGMK